MSIRLGAEKRAEELGYNILKVSQLEQHNLQGIDGILAIGKFKRRYKSCSNCIQTFV